MKVKGDVEVILTDGDKVVSRINTTNTFTNAGKQLICDWLLHDNFSIDADTPATYPEGGGRSLSAMKIVPYTSITPHWVDHVQNGNPNLLMHPIGSCAGVYSTIATTDYSYFRHWTSKNYDYGTIYFEFDEPKQLTALLIGLQHWAYGHDIEWQVSVSPSSYAVNNPWTVVGYFVSACQTNVNSTEAYSTNPVYTEQMIRLQNSIDCPDIHGTALENVKTVRLAIRSTDTNQTMRVFGLWLFEQNYYPNNPSVIALGTSNTAPSVSNTALGAEDNRGWLKTVAYHDENKITFSRKIEAADHNDIEFKEVGLMFFPDKGRVHGGDNGPELATGLFARAVFPSPWQKTSAQCATINYTISLI